MTALERLRTGSAKGHAVDLHQASIEPATKRGHKFKWTRRVAVFAAAIPVMIGGGVAFASWSASGSGSGAAQAGNVTPLKTVTATTTSLGLLFPGGTGDLKVTFDNPNPFPVTITSVTAGTGAITGSGGLGTCSATGVTFTAPTSPSIALPAASGGTDGTTTKTFLNALSMSASSDNGCQEATFSVPLAFSASTS
jgi:hypothetical protein